MKPLSVVAVVLICCLGCKTEGGASRLQNNENTVADVSGKPLNRVSSAKCAGEQNHRAVLTKSGSQYTLSVADGGAAVTYNVALNSIDDGQDEQSWYRINPLDDSIGIVLKRDGSEVVATVLASGDHLWCTSVAY